MAKIDPHRILLCRTDSIGDVILTLPVASFLKHRHPNVEIIFLGSSYTSDIVRYCHDVDSFISWDALKQLPLEEQTQTIKDLDIDTAILVFPQKDIAKLLKAAKIPHRYGTSHRIYNWLTCNHLVNLSRKNSPLHEAQLNIALCRDLLGATTPSLQNIAKHLVLYPSPLRQELSSLLDPSRFNLILHPKSKGSAREWGVDNYKTLIEMLPEDKFKIFVTGTQAEGELLHDGLLRPCQGRITNLIGMLTLSELVSFISKSDGLIAASTGPLHIAAATGIHAIGLFPPIRPMHPGRWRPIGDKVKVFVKDKECNECRNLNTCRCISEILPETVCQYLLSILIQ